jgi:prevent-host-death family protein
MAIVASRDLRNHTASVLNRVREGERVTITIAGEPVAQITPVEHAKPLYFTRSTLIGVLARCQADPGLTADLAALTDDTTDDLDPL